MSDDNVDALFAYDRPELTKLWASARAALESPAQRAAIHVDLPDVSTRHEIAALLGSTRAHNGKRRRIVLSELDSILRSDRFGLSLVEVLELLHGEPITRRESSATLAQRRRDTTQQILVDALSEHHLDNATWAAQWIIDIHRYSKVDSAQLPLLASRAAAILAQLELPTGTNREWISRGDLAARFGGGAHSLDPGQPLERIVLRAAAIAHNLAMPYRSPERRNLWERCRVALDSVSATVLCYAIPWDGDEPWSKTLRERTAQKLPTHLTLRDLAAAPHRLVQPGTMVSICENPRLIDAEIDAALTHPLICVSGHLTTPERVLLTRLAADGADTRYHGDFDPDGLIITHQVLQLTNGQPWRMSSHDYRHGLASAEQQGIELQHLTSSLPATPWDPELATAMDDAGITLEEEVILDDLLGDLGARASGST